jgi:hypothetical protein
MPSAKLTPNQIVAWNLKRVRTLSGLTQEQAAEKLEPYLGERWSVAVFSAAERSIEGKRIRQFTADDIHAFARAFDLPVALFLTPPSWAETIGHAASDETVSRSDYLDSIFDLPENARERLVSDVLEFSAPTTRMLRRWGANLATLIEDWERRVAAAGFELPKESPES